MQEKNLILPGNPRYQPQKLKEYFGYDNLFRTVGEVEIANIETMAEVGLIPYTTSKLFTKEVQRTILDLRTTDIENTERRITKHDIRAWVYEAEKVTPKDIARWLHVLLTSYDPLDTGRILQFSRTYTEVVRPSCVQVLTITAKLVEKYASTLQIGRTHGQHALPITVGFWLATVLNRMHYNFVKMEAANQELVGKISGAVGAYNAQVGLGVTKLCNKESYEERVLSKVGLKPAPISTQILSPEPLAYYLYSCAMFSATLGQFGRDCRHLMRSEIGEITEEFSSSQSGSSTMAHKRNPISFENLEGMWIRTKNEFGKVLDTLISEHQRDLVGSSVARDFPIIIVNLVTQLNTLLRQDEEGIPFLQRMSVNTKACEKNFNLNAHVILSEPLYIAIQMAGFTGDGHKLVNHTLVPTALKLHKPLIQVAEEYAQQNEEFATYWQQIPSEVITLLHQPTSYTGLAEEKALYIANKVLNDPRCQL